MREFPTNRCPAMKPLPALGALLLLLGSAFALRLVYHSYTHHDNLDVFHVIVGISTALLAVALLWRARTGRRT